MNFVLASTLFVSGSPIQLLRLWGAALDGRHRIEVREDAELAWQAFQAKLDDATREELDGARNWSDHENAERPSGVTVFVDERKASAWSKLELTLDDAVDLASRPFRILLENAASDGLFLRAMLTPDERAWFDNLVKREWLLLETTGGVTELKKRVDWAREEDSRLLRIAALFDGDAVEPPRSTLESQKDLRARLHSNSRAVLDACEQAQFGDSAAFPHHVTRRRSIENYIPIPALERWVDRVDSHERETARKRVKALAGFAHKHWFNMKDGHEGDRKRNPPISWLPPDKNSRLEEGFGAPIAMCFADVSSAEFQADGSFDELRSFILALRRRIS
jgi:hypothetical protein